MKARVIKTRQERIELLAKKVEVGGYVPACLERIVENERTRINSKATSIYNLNELNSGARY